MRNNCVVSTAAFEFSSLDGLLRGGGDVSVFCAELDGSSMITCGIVGVSTLCSTLPLNTFAPKTAVSAAFCDVSSLAIYACGMK